MSNNPLNVPPVVNRTLKPTVVTRTVPTVTRTTTVTPMTRTTPTTVVTRTPTISTMVTRTPIISTPTPTRVIGGPNTITNTNNTQTNNYNPTINITSTSGGGERLNTSHRRSNRGLNLGDSPNDRRSIVSFRQLEDTMPTKGDKRRTIKAPMGVDRSNRVSRLTPEEKDRRKTIRQSMRQEESAIQMQMHKFVQEMSSIEEKMQQERRYNEELTDNYNELLDILINTVTQLEDLLPNYGKLREQPSQPNFQDFEKDLNVFRTGIYRSIGEVHRNQAKERLDEEKTKISKPNSTPTPPTPPPPPSLAKAKGPAVNLLSEIHRGINLKKVDQDNVKREHDNLMVKSVSTLSDLQDILSKALNERANQILGNDEEDWSDEDDEDWKS